MSVPVTKVEFGFTQSAGAYVYQDITPYVRAVNIDRGISRNGDVFDAGSASVVLDNRAREFDPNYTQVVSTLTNQIYNPSFETNTTGWTVRNGAIATLAASAVSGSYVCEYTSGVTGTQGGLLGNSTTTYMPAVTAGNTYTWSVYVKDISTGQSQRPYIEWRDASNTILSTTTGTTQAVSTSVWTRVSLTAVAPANAAYARPYCYTPSTLTNGLKVYYDAAMFTASSAVIDYFDGDTTDTTQITYAWSGTANNSTSTAAIKGSKYGSEVKTQAAVRITTGNFRRFTGFVDNWTWDYQVSGDSTATMNCLDGTSRLSAAALDAHTPAAEKTNVRVSNVLDRSEVNWPASLRSIDAGAITMGTTPVAAGTKAWDYLTQVSQSEGGAIFVDANNNVCLRTQNDNGDNVSQTTTRYNKCSMPSFESATLVAGDAAWTIGSRSSLIYKYGSYSASEATFLDPSDLTGGFVTGSKYYDATASKWSSNTTYTISVWVYMSDANYYDVSLYAGSGIVGVENLQDVVSDTANIKSSDGWVQLSVQITPSRVNKPLCVWVTRSGGSVYTDGLLIEESIYVQEYFDGGYKPSDTATTTYSNGWDGVANLSTSFLTAITTYTAAQPDAVYFADDGTNIPFTDVQLTYSSDTNYNRIQIVNATGTAVTANDASAGTAYGIRTYTQDTNLSSSLADGTAVANYYLDAYRNPDLRFESISTELAALTETQQASVLAIDIWDAADITYTPSRVGSALTSIERVVGISDTILPDRHLITFNLASYPSRFILNSMVQGVLDASRLGSP